MRALLPAALLLLAGCGDRRTFDERFNDTQAELQQRSAELEQKLNEEQAPPANESGNRSSVR